MAHSRKTFSLITLLAVGCSVIGCDRSGSSIESARNDSVQQIDRVALRNETGEPPLKNLIRVSQTVYSGAQPQGSEAFASLQQLGVKTIVSVDGAEPDVGSAKKFGLRYVHIPIGYDGVRKDAGLALTRLVREVEGPIYMHCHHGVHRGPAAAAVACMAAGEIDVEKALELLKLAGTSPEYAGLWRDVKNYKVPDNGVELPPLVEIAEVSSMAVAMAQIHRAYDNLKLCQNSDWMTPPEHPDVLPAREALLLKEGFRESSRSFKDENDPELNKLLRQAENSASRLEQLLNSNREQAERSKTFQQIGVSCKHCHQRFRD